MNKFTRISAALALATAFSAPVMAEPVTYVLDNTHTFPTFSYQHLGFSTQVQKFKNTTGTVVFDSEAKTAEVDVNIDMTSIETGTAVFNEHIQGEDFFNTAKYPNATFKSTKVVFDGDNLTAVEGDLTIKGVTKPVVLDVTHFVQQPHPMLQKDAIGANASVVIKRSDFNADKFVPNISDEITINIALEALAQ